MPTGAIHLRDQLSPVNPYTKVRPQPAIAPPAKTQAQRQTAEASQQQKRAQHNPNNTQLLTSSAAIQQFETRLDQLQVPDLQHPDATWRQRFVNFVAKAANLTSNAALGKGTTTAEVHGLAGLSGGYAANTPGGLVDISLNGSVDPTVSTTEAGIEKWGTDKALSGGSNPTGVTLGGLTSLAGLILSGKALKHGIQTFNLGSADANYAAQLRNLHNLLVPDPPGEPNLALARQTLDQDIQAIDQRAQQLEQRAGNNPEDEQFRNEAALLRLRQGELQQRLGALGDEEAPPEADNLAQIAQQFNQEAAALDKLAHIKKVRGGVDSFEAAMGLVASGNGLINAIFTGVSIGVPTGETAGNLIANTLIATQAIGGGMAAITGTYGAIKSSVEAHKSTQRIAKANDFIQDPAFGNHEGVKKIKDTAQLIKRENQERRMFKVMTAVKSTLMAGAGISLTVGAIGGAAVLAATPVGWALGGCALVGGIGVGCYKLYQKRSQTKQIAQLEQQNERLKAQRTAVRQELIHFHQQDQQFQEQINQLTPQVQAQADLLQPLQAQAQQITEGLQANQLLEQQLGGVIIANQQTVQQIAQRIQGNQQVVQDLQGVISANQQTVQQITQRIQDNQQVVQDLGGVISTNQRTVQQITQRIQDNQQQVLILTTEIQQLLQQKKDVLPLQQTQQHLQQTIQQDQEAQVQLQETLQEQGQTRQALQQTIQQDQEAQVQLQETLQEQGQTRQALEQTIQQDQEAQVQLQETLQEQGQTHQALQQTIQQDQHAHQQLQFQIQPIQIQHDQLDVQLQQVTQQSAQVQARIIGKDQEYQYLEDVRAEVKMSLRQLSPSAALKTLVNALQGNKGPEAQAAAEALGRELLGIAPGGNIDVLRGEPAVVAEVLRKHLGLAYL
jgi:hypothetical protein